MTKECLSYDATMDHLEQLTSGGWYPANHSCFYTVQGIEDLLNTLCGSRANTIQEALNYIDTRSCRAQINLQRQNAAFHRMEESVHHNVGLGAKQGLSL